MHRRDEQPGALAWLVGLASLALLVPRAVLAWAWLWPPPWRPRSDQPGLSHGPHALAGRVLEVTQAIENGRGRVRAGDTVWSAEGPDVPAGARVTVTGVRDTMLVVEHATL